MLACGLPHCPISDKLTFYRVRSLSTDAHRITVATPRLVEPEASAQDLEVGPHLLGPVARDAPADREDAHALVLADAIGEVLEVAVAVVVENGGGQGKTGSGNAIASPIAKKVMEAVLSK